MEIGTGLLTAIIYDALKKGISFIEPTFNGFLVETFDQLSEKYRMVRNEQIKQFFLGDKVSLQIQNYKQKGIEPDYDELLTNFQQICNGVSPQINAKPILDELFHIIEHKLISNPAIHEKIKLHYLQKISKNLETSIDELKMANRQITNMDINLKSLGSKILFELKTLSETKQDIKEKSPHEFTKFDITIAKLFANNYDSFKVEIRNAIFDLSKNNKGFSMAFGARLGRVFSSLEKNIREEIWENLKKNEVISTWFSYALGYDFETFEGEFQKELWLRVESSKISYGIVLIIFQKLITTNQKIIDKTFEAIKHYNSILVILSIFIGQYFLGIRHKTRQIFWNIAKKDEYFAFCLGYTIIMKFRKLKPTIRKEIWKIAIQNKRIAEGMGMAFADPKILSFNDPLWKEIWKNLIKNPHMATNFGSTLPIRFEEYSKDERKFMWKKSKENEQVAVSVATLIPRYFKSYKKESQREIISEISTNKNLKNFSINKIHHQ